MKVLDWIHLYEYTALKCVRLQIFVIGFMIGYFSIWLLERVAEYFKTNQKVQWSKTNAVLDYCQHCFETYSEPLQSSGAAIGWQATHLL